MPRHYGGRGGRHGGHGHRPHRSHRPHRHYGYRRRRGVTCSMLMGFALLAGIAVALILL